MAVQFKVARPLMNEIESGPEVWSAELSALELPEHLAKIVEGAG